MRNNHIYDHKYGLYTLLSLILIFSPISSSVMAQGHSDNRGPIFMETVWITTDRSIYLPGESVNFSAILMENDSYLPSSLSRIVKCEILDSKGLQVFQKEFILDNSRINNQLQIPLSASSGWYYIRAYTNWMRNSADAINNYLPIKVVRPVGDGEQFNIQGSNTIDIKIIPENNKLIAGELNRCALTAELENGVEMEVSGVLLTAFNDTVVSFNTDRTGWGNISFIPNEGEDYRVSLNNKADEEVSLIMPEIQNNSPYCTFNKEGLNITLKATRIKTDSVRLLIHRNYTWYGYYVAAVKDDEVTITMPLKNLPAGIYQASLFSESYTNIFKRLFIVGEIRGDDPVITISPGIGNSGTVQISYTISEDQEGSERLINSIVSRAEPLELNNYYIPGLPGWSFSYDIPLDKEALSGWLIANNYADNLTNSFFDRNQKGPLQHTLDIQTQVDKRALMFRYLPETKGFVLSGSLKDNNGLPLVRKLVNATMLEDNSIFAGFTFDSGRFHIPILYIEGTHEYIVGPTSQLEPGWKLNIEPRFDTNRIQLPQRSFTISIEEANFIRELDLNRQLDVIYNTLKEKDIDIVSVDTVKKLFYAKPNYSTNIDDYIKLSNIREVLFEVVSKVTVRKSSGKYRLGIVSDTPMSSQYDALFLLDGIPFYDFSEFLNLPPDRLENIDVVNQQYIHGNAIISGIVSFNSKNKDLAGLSLPRQSIVTAFDMPEPGLAGIRPTNSKSKYIPDLTHTLHWNSFSSALSENYQIQLNDNQYELITRVFGFNNSGQWISIKKPVTSGGN